MRFETSKQSELTVDDDCARIGMGMDELMHSLDEASQHESHVGELKGFRLAPLTKVINYIAEKHHAFTRRELVCLDALLNKVCAVHGAIHTELLRIQSLFKSIVEELSAHMLREEQLLFPYIVQMEDAINHRIVFPRPVFGTIRIPSQQMVSEHARVANVLSEIHKLSLNYTVPPDGCQSYRLLYQTLKDFEQDLQQHTYLEDQVVFPRAVKMESMAYPALDSLPTLPQSLA
jgi:regulator of cell morphogenesis and NO signaling